MLWEITLETAGLQATHDDAHRRAAAVTSNANGLIP